VSPDAEVIDLAIVGAGRWGQRLVESVQARSDRVRFTAAVTRDPARLAAWAERTNVELHPTLADVLNEPGITGVVLATPHNQHAQEVELCARAGKHVFCEKPFSLTHADAAGAAGACAAAGVILAVGHNRRFLPSFQALRTQLEDGRLGLPLHVEGHFSAPSGHRYTGELWRADRGQSPAGGMTGLGIHLIDAMVALMGPVAAVRADSRRRVLSTIDDTTSVFLELTSGAVGTLVTLTASPLHWHLRVSGSAGRAEMIGERTLVTATLDEPPISTTWPHVDIERQELDAFAAAIRGDPPFPVPPDEAVHGIAVLEAIVQSAEEGQALVRVATG
jgi:predicted dehydrogenase